MALIYRSIELVTLAMIMLIGIVALVTELIEYEEIAKIVVIPSLTLLIIVTGYTIFKASRLTHF